MSENKDTKETYFMSGTVYRITCPTDISSGDVYLMWVENQELPEGAEVIEEEMATIWEGEIF